jgi:CRP-like cAMP-binding protein
MNIARSLAEVPVFAPVDESIRRDLASHIRVIERERRQSVIRQGAHADALFVVVRGHLKISLHGSNGSATSVSVLGPGDTFGELGVLGESARSAAVTTLEAATLFRLPGAAFLEAMSKSAALGLSVSRLLAHRLRTMGDHLSDIGALDASTRLAQRVLWLLERFERRRGAVSCLDLPLTQLDLAELAQLSRQRTNRSLQELKRRGVIDWRARRLVILDRAELKRVAGGEGPVH